MFPPEGSLRPLDEYWGFDTHRLGRRPGDGVTGLGLGEADLEEV